MKPAKKFTKERIVSCDAEQETLNDVPKITIHADKFTIHFPSGFDDNSLAERTVQPFVIGRKNFLFSNMPAGADSTELCK